jgi:type II secretory pathway pseudopilin PulG
MRGWKCGRVNILRVRNHPDEEGFSIVSFFRSDSAGHVLARRKGANVRAFTLVEILAAMAVLVVLVLGLARAFNDSVAAFRRGVTTVERNGAVQVAMEQIARDLDGAIVNERFAMYQVADQVDSNFDALWFVTTTSDQDTAGDADPSAYHFVRYYVSTQTITYIGMQYKKFRLMRETWKMQLLRARNVDPMGADKQWWDRAPSAAGSETVTILDNVIRFDVYVHNHDGELIRAFGDTFNSTMSSGIYVSNMPPAAIDIYLQATSEETMRQAGRILVTSPSNVAMVNQARSMMIRDSNMLTMRVTPFAAAGQWMYPAQFYY